MVLGWGSEWYRWSATKDYSLLPHSTLDSEVKTGERMMYGKFIAGHVSEECILGVSSSIQDVGSKVNGSTATTALQYKIP